MNPVTLAPPRGTRMHHASGGLGCLGSGMDWCGRPVLSEYNDDVFKQNRREDVLLTRRLQLLDRRRSDVAAQLRQAAEATMRLHESASLQRSPSLTEYDEWRTVRRYCCPLVGLQIEPETQKSDGKTVPAPAAGLSGVTATNSTINVRVWVPAKGETVRGRVAADSSVRNLGRNSSGEDKPNVSRDDRKIAKKVPAKRRPITK